MCLLVGVCYERLAIYRVDQIISAVSGHQRLHLLRLNEIKGKAVRLRNRIVVKATVLDVLNVLVKMFLDTESLRCDSLQVILERFQHPYSLL